MFNSAVSIVPADGQARSGVVSPTGTVMINYGFGMNETWTSWELSFNMSMGQCKKDVTPVR